MKKSKILMMLLAIWSMFSSITTVYAASATVGFSGNSTVAVGDNITVKMYISNVSDTVGGVVSAGGNLTFDSSYLEYVSGTGISTPYSFQINESANYIVAGLDTTLANGITGSGQTTVFTFVFKALKKGTTEVTLTNAKLSDTNAKITSNVNAKTITITDPSEGGGEEPPTSPSKSSDANLKSLIAEGYSLSPSFSPSTTSYTVKVASDAKTVILDGLANDSKATVSGLGSITLTGDTTTATVKVTAEDGTTKSYTLKFVKDSDTDANKKDSDATLKSLDVSGYTLSPTFKKNVNTYSMKVANNITALNVSAIPTSDKAKVTITGNTNWKEGNNVITIKVTAEDGSTNTYIVNVERAGSNKETETTTKSSDNYLKDLVINSPHEINTKFDKDTSVYNITVPYEVDKLDLSAITNNSKAKYEITGNENFKVGQVNTVTIKVTAENGAVRTYTLNVTRSSQTSDTTLKDLVVKDGTLSPAFDPNNTKYTVTVGSDVDKLDISAIPNSENAKVEIIGNENLKEGKNTVIVSVTDENGYTRNYVLEVEKEAKAKTTIFGLAPWQFLLALGAILIPLILLLLFLLLLFRRKKEKEKEKEYRTPIIEVKPEFNFGSKNTSDDDIVHGNLNQESTIIDDDDDDDEEEYEDYDDFEDKYPYDLYDETVTKKEIVDAIHEAVKTKDSSKLKMLLEQDSLNQKKKEMKKKENRKKRRDYED